MESHQVKVLWTAMDQNNSHTLFVILPHVVMCSPVFVYMFFVLYKSRVFDVIVRHA